MRIKNLLNKLRNVPKRYAAAVAAGLVIALPIAVKAGYGPTRPVLFDWNNPADRKGSLTGPVFNSFINTPTYGDERPFVDAKDAANAAPGGFADVVNVEGGKEYTIRAYVHNNGNQDLNDAEDGFKSVAKNAKVRFNVLTGISTGNEVTGYISADNAVPAVVYDTVKLKNDTQEFSLEYVAGSARMESNAHPFPGVALPDTIVTTGALIGDNLDGDLPGCFQYTQVVTIKVLVKTPKLQFSKKVTTPGSTNWQKNLNAKKGDTVSWLLDYKNVGTGLMEDVTLRDQIPSDVTLVPGSVTWIDSNHPSGEALPDTALGSGGTNVGNYGAQGGGYIRFRTTVNNDPKECVIKNIAYARATNIPEVSDEATVTVEDCDEQETPVYRCDLLSVQFVSGRTYRYTVNATATGGATITQYMFNFGDNQTLNTTNTVVDHTYATEGTYVAVVKVQVRVNGQDVVAESAACAKPITITKENCPIIGKESLPKNSPECKEVPKENCPIPGKGNLPKNSAECVLPNTGAGDLVGMFAATSAFGALAYHFVLSRRFDS